MPKILVCCCCQLFNACKMISSCCWMMFRPWSYKSRIGSVVGSRVDFFFVVFSFFHGPFRLLLLTSAVVLWFLYIRDVFIKTNSCLVFYIFFFFACEFLQFLSQKLINSEIMFLKFWMIYAKSFRFVNDRIFHSRN